MERLLWKNESLTIRVNKLLLFYLVILFKDRKKVSAKGVIKWKSKRLALSAAE